MHFAGARNFEDQNSSTVSRAVITAGELGHCVGGKDPTKLYYCYKLTTKYRDGGPARYGIYMATACTLGHAHDRHLVTNQ